jgi:PTH2 family peptidyl-tRNA hydrolase
MTTKCPLLYAIVPLNFFMKQVLVMRADLGMSPGKLAAQAAHAAVNAADKTQNHIFQEWQRDGSTKVVLEVWDEETLIKLYKLAVAAYLPAVLIADEGRTEVKPGSITALGIGPAPDSDVNAITGSLNLYGKNVNKESAES